MALNTRSQCAKHKGGRGVAMPVNPLKQRCHFWAQFQASLEAYE